jgi:molybdate transport system substrate-binding protein
VRHIAIANPDHAPYGAAAKQALESAGLWDKLRPKIVYGENVRQAWQFAESGNADAAIVSHSLVRDSGVLIDRPAHQPIRHAAAIVARSNRAADGQRFLDWLSGPGGQALLAKFGFAQPGSSGVSH